jgi:enoyl-CoA hydratase
MSDEVLVEHDNGLVVITINRPQVKNAVNRAVSYGVCEAIDEMERRSDLHLAILTGAGGTFCAGMDLKAFAAGEVTRVEGRGLLGIVNSPPKKPLIAAVEGHALAGGFEAVLACDLLVASRTAMFGLPEAKRGLMAGAGGLLRLPRVIPQRIAMEMALTGDMVSAERMERFGLVNRLVDPGQALAEAKVLARLILANAPQSVQRSKQVIVEQRDWPLAEQFARQDVVLGDFRNSNDAKEGARAFVEKRPPRWTGT